MSDLISTEDLEQLKEIMDDEFDMLVSMFVDDSTTLVNTIESTIASQDAEALRVASHTLKGSSSNMCVLSISGICANIESKAKEGDFSGLEELLSELKEIHPKVIDMLKNF
ncbi:MAG: Hpt domain-containing protein [Gammaproteobacteria bacterium]|nr:Hpt domain-containing protein [Gammaproteobacteria bacterium]